jgi:hypothetical protein
MKRVDDVGTDAAAVETDSLLQAKCERQQHDRNDVRSGRRSQASMLRFDADEVRKNWVVRRRWRND